MRLFLHFSEVIRIACESLSMYQNIHVVELIILFNVNHCTISESQMFLVRKMSSSSPCPLPTQWKECHLWEQFVSVDLRLWGVPDFGQCLLQSYGLLLKVLKFFKQYLNLKEKKLEKKERGTSLLQLLLKRSKLKNGLTQSLSHSDWVDTSRWHKLLKTKWIISTSHQDDLTLVNYLWQ